MRLSESLKEIGRAVGFHPEVARFLGSIPATLLLEQLHFWHDKTKPEAENWIFKSVAELQDETSLSYRQQQSARKLLRHLGIMSERRERFPYNRQFFRLNIDALDRLWGEWLAKNRRARPAKPEPASDMRKGQLGQGQNDITKGQVPCAERASRTMQEITTREEIEATPCVAPSTSLEETEKQEQRFRQPQLPALVSKEATSAREPAGRESAACAAPRIDFDGIVAQWNSAAESLGLAKVVTLTDARRAGIRRRLAEPVFDLEKVLEGIRQSGFLRGQNDRGWRVDFDYVFESASGYVKILEGKFRDKPKASPPQTRKWQPPVDQGLAPGQAPPQTQRYNPLPEREDLRPKTPEEKAAQAEWWRKRKEELGILSFLNAKPEKKPDLHTLLPVDPPTPGGPMAEFLKGRSIRDLTEAERNDLLQFVRKAEEAEKRQRIIRMPGETPTANPDEK